MTALPADDGKLTKRREFLGRLGSVAALASLSPASVAQAGSATAAAACLLTPAATEGPFYLGDARLRSDIRDGRPGQPLRLRLTVVDADRGCIPVPGALVSIWHCDAEGSYSGEDGPHDTTRFLRGVQQTGADGAATFLTIYPGWYRPRAVHIHFKVLLANAEVLTSQLYFSDALNREVLGNHPAYRTRGAPTRGNTQDPIAGSNPPLVRVRSATDWLDGEFVAGIARVARTG
ncbi:intradiol ring-cleavage dioxygenase [Cupriavidus sp. WKF15]|uniref:intradiol ring-cleavage dioxygenase n=1 Tax=Cupriavidus sp. WKF15 TaxID=3032282 RepID=UPI0023E10E7C|nr:intradiol ring-cleavage dioxygenase [Cupriavidus sp. WKF15]WER49489.1 intradiol ring-cleavage dioxygenase [Cupriavidus sp. WKF15]